MTTKSEDQLKSTACAIAFLRCTFACFKDPALRYDPRTLNFEGKILKLLPGMVSFTGLPQSLEGCRKLARQLEQGRTKFENGMEDHWGGISLNCARCKVVDEVIGKWAQNLEVINNATSSGGETILTQQSQLVMLGAGLDFRARRHAAKDGVLGSLSTELTVFELDLPPMISVREKLLKQIDESESSTGVTFRHISIDFNSESLKEKLLSNGFDENLPTLFIWEGVTYYLQPDAVKRTLKMINECGNEKRTHLLFDYLDARVVNKTHPHPAGELMRSEFQEVVNEPLLWGLEFDETEKYANDNGYKMERHWMPEDFEKQGYLGTNGLTMKASPFFGMALLRN